MKQNIPFNADPMGAAIYDYYNTGSADALVVHSSMFEDDEIPVDALFRDFEHMPELEKAALELSSGRILDVGPSGCWCRGPATWEQLRKRCLPSSS